MSSNRSFFLLLPSKINAFVVVGSNNGDDVCCCCHDSLPAITSGSLLIGLPVSEFVSAVLAHPLAMCFTVNCVLPCFAFE